MFLHLCDHDYRDDKTLARGNAHHSDKLMALQHQVFGEECRHGFYCYRLMTYACYMHDERI